MKLNLFSVPIFIDNIDSSKIDIKNQNFEKTWNSETISSFNSTNLLDKESVNYLLGIISNSISKEFNETLKIQLLNIWENRYTDNDFQEKHTHPQAHFSFIIYKEVIEGKTIFFNPAINLIESYYPAPYFFDKTNFFQVEFLPKCRKDQIVIFPSFLEHMVKKINNSVTISGNITIHPNNPESKW
jgi:hypothetical protein|tara:strand:+ start:268 stop:822 length:555 start_codon:yes stop_codon:yes gene_type:complete